MIQWVSLTTLLPFTFIPPGNQQLQGHNIWNLPWTPTTAGSHLSPLRAIRQESEMSQNKTKSHQHAHFSKGRASTELYSILFYSYSTFPHQTQFLIPNDFESYNDKNGETA